MLANNAEHARANTDPVPSLAVMRRFTWKGKIRYLVNTSLGFTKKNPTTYPDFKVYSNKSVLG